MSLLSRAVFGICAIALAAAQSGQPAPQQPEATTIKQPVPAPPQAETTTREEPATFKARVNLVMVPVVVRDKAGRAVGSLKQEDFQLFDKGKPQYISRFSVEKLGLPPEKGAKPAKSETGDQPLEMPERYIAYLFDDIHISFADLARTRDAAWKHISSDLRPTDRAAIYTTSGRDIVEFTDNKDKIHEVLMRLFPHPIDTRGIQKCPDVGYYLADLIQNKNDPMALQSLITETLSCAQLDPATGRTIAESMVRAAAGSGIAVGDQESRLSLGLLRDIIRRMGVLPGQRSIILTSPGFIIPQLEQELTDVMDRAIKATITINTLDARGLYVDPSIDASQRGFSVAAMNQLQQYMRAEASADADVLAALAYGTGGNFFENNNDLEAGFRKLATVPEYLYLLGFSPQNLKLDGGFHAVKVTLKSTALVATARKGYYAPRKLSDPAETAKEELREALFSREELKELPVSLHTQFFKPSNETARVTVVASIDLKQLRFRVDGDRHRNDLTIVAALFDRNGNWVTGTQKLVEMRLKEATLDRPSASGFTIRSTFDVKPGGYLVRLVVRDAEGQQMAAQNGSVEIP